MVRPITATGNRGHAVNTRFRQRRRRNPGLVAVDTEVALADVGRFAAYPEVDRLGGRSSPVCRCIGLVDLVAGEAVLRQRVFNIRRCIGFAGFDPFQEALAGMTAGATSLVMVIITSGCVDGVLPLEQFGRN